MASFGTNLDKLNQPYSPSVEQNCFFRPSNAHIKSCLVGVSQRQRHGSEFSIRAGAPVLACGSGDRVADLYRAGGLLGMFTRLWVWAMPAIAKWTPIGRLQTLRRLRSNFDVFRGVEETMMTALCTLSSNAQRICPFCKLIKLPFLAQPSDATASANRNW